MIRNHGKISPRNEQRHRRDASSPKSGYFVLLLLLIIGITGYYVFSRGILFSHTTEAPSSSPQTTKKELPKTPTKPRFEFYTLLSQETVPVSREKNEDNNDSDTVITADATTP